MRPAALLAALCFSLPAAAEEAKTYDLRRKYKTGETWTLAWERTLTPADGKPTVESGRAKLKVVRAEKGRLMELEARFEKHVSNGEPLHLSGRIVLLKRTHGGLFTMKSLMGKLSDQAVHDTLTRSLASAWPLPRLSKWNVGSGAFGLLGLGNVEKLRFRLDKIDTGKERTLATVSAWCELGSLKLEGAMLVDVSTGIRQSLRLKSETPLGTLSYVLREHRPRAAPEKEEAAPEETPEAEPEEPTPAPTPYKSPRGGFSLDIPEGWADTEIADGMGVRLTQRAAHATVEVRTHKVARGTTAARFFKAVLMPRLEGQGAQFTSDGAQKVGGHAGYGARYSGDGKSGWIVVVVAGARAWSFHSRIPANAIDLVMPEVRDIAASLRLPPGEGGRRSR